MDAGVKWLTEWSAAQLPDGAWYTDLISSGIIGGVGAVIVFLPQILILYFFISILEDSGYLARAALLFDPILDAWDSTANLSSPCSRALVATYLPSWRHAPLKTARVACSP